MIIFVTKFKILERDQEKFRAILLYGDEFRRSRSLTFKIAVEK